MSLTVPSSVSLRTKSDPAKPSELTEIVSYFSSDRGTTNIQSLVASIPKRLYVTQEVKDRLGIVLPISIRTIVAHYTRERARAQSRG